MIAGITNNLLDGVTATTTGTAVPITDKVFKNLYISAEDWNGGTVLVEWSLDGTNAWTTLTGPEGNAISVTANAMYTSLSLYGAYYRARFNGTGATNVCVRLV